MVGKVIPFLSRGSCLGALRPLGAKSWRDEDSFGGRVVAYISGQVLAVLRFEPARVGLATLRQDSPNADFRNSARRHFVGALKRLNPALLEHQTTGARTPESVWNFRFHEFCQLLQ
jgi:hypothetical protein